ncbi:CynX/NimT family MFS transporter [Micromonospora sp. NBC_01796]|uniref:CynX/NimT family MFS transporter n=1 Tax=Micromonospora sp. NBC_01796 TaxID=2975987 RepID=UPI002DD93456|nr:MFS transporter [Micromonospora sp. NBC_01796]WSA85413.1 MFS transporter [Micromonospora sp. NBC_01796]
MGHAAGCHHPVPVLSRRVAPWLTLLGVLLLALNLRAAIAGLSPLLPDVQADLDLARATAGLLTTLPVLCFGLLSSPAALLGRRIGVEPALLAALVGVVAGSVLRVFPGVPAMIAGTALIGAGITIGNVLLPSVVKQDFPHRQGLLTGLTTAAMTGGAALAAAVTVPLAHSAGLGWRVALLAVAAPAVVAALVWLPQLSHRHAAPTVTVGAAAVRRAPLTWQLAAFMAMQALTYYGVLAWLPALLRDHGVSVAGAGWGLALFNVLGVGTAVLAPMLAVRRPDQRALTVVVCAGWALGLAGLLVAPGAYPVWCAIAGLAQGAGIGLALTLIVLRARTPESARDLSGTVQSVGYLVGSTGPLLMGLLRDASGGWTLPLLTLLVAVAVMTFAGAGAARDRQV